MTTLRRRLTRKAPAAYDHHGAPLVVTLEPTADGILVTIREARRRYKVAAPLATLYRWLMRAEADARRAARGRRVRP